MTVFSFAFMIRTSVYHPVLEDLGFEILNSPSSASSGIEQCPLDTTSSARDYYKMMKAVEPKHVKAKN